MLKTLENVGSVGRVVIEAVREDVLEDSGGDFVAELGVGLMDESSFGVILERGSCVGRCEIDGCCDWS